MNHENKISQSTSKCLYVLILDGFQPTTIQVFVNGDLIFKQLSQFGYRGASTLFVGSTPDVKYHYYGRLYSLMVGALLLYFIHSMSVND